MEEGSEQQLTMARMEECPMHSFSPEFFLEGTNSNFCKDIIESTTLSKPQPSNATKEVYIHIYDPLGYKNTSLPKITTAKY